MTAAATAAPRAARPGGGRIRVDLQLVADLVPRGARVLDVGCGEGELLFHLAHAKDIDGRGIEIDRHRVAACLNQGLSVIQGDAEADIRDFPADAFDFVILSQTLQAVREPRPMLQELLRVGRHAVVSITNAGYWRNRLGFAFGGRVPFREAADEHWYDTPNIHPCTLRDFVALTREMGVAIERCTVIRASGAHHEADPESAAANLLAVQAIFLIR